MYIGTDSESLNARSLGNAHLVIRVDGSEFVSYINVEDLISGGGSGGLGTNIAASVGSYGSTANGNASI